MSDPTEGMTEAEMAAYYNRTHDLSGFMTDDCYCVCHSPYSSRPQCEHCSPNAGLREVNEGEADLMTEEEEVAEINEGEADLMAKLHPLSGSPEVVHLVARAYLNARWPNIEWMQDPSPNLLAAMQAVLVAVEKLSLMDRIFVEDAKLLNRLGNIEDARAHPERRLPRPRRRTKEEEHVEESSGAAASESARESEQAHPVAAEPSSARQEEEEG